MLEIRTEPFDLAGRKLTVCEANWQMSRKYAQMEAEAREHPSENPLEIYMDSIYPSLAAYTVGEDVPTKAEALKMVLEQPDLFDAWFCAVRQLNPTKFKANGHEPGGKDDTRVVKFRDGSQITVTSSYNHPSYAFKAQTIHEQVVQSHTSDDAEAFVFQTRFYPAMAACSSGDIPGVDELNNWPETELSQWYQACIELSPSLFPGIVSEAERANEDSKKKPAPKRTRQRSSHG